MLRQVELPIMESGLRPIERKLGGTVRQDTLLDRIALLEAHGREAALALTVLSHVQGYAPEQLRGASDVVNRLFAIVGLLPALGRLLEEAPSLFTPQQLETLHCDVDGIHAICVSIDDGREPVSSGGSDGAPRPLSEYAIESFLIDLRGCFRDLVVVLSTIRATQLEENKQVSSTDHGARESRWLREALKHPDYPTSASITYKAPPQHPASLYTPQKAPDPGPISPPFYAHSSTQDVIELQHPRGFRGRYGHPDYPLPHKQAVVYLSSPDPGLRFEKSFEEAELERQQLRDQGRYPDIASFGTWPPHFIAPNSVQDHQVRAVMSANSEDVPQQLSSPTETPIDTPASTRDSTPAADGSDTNDFETIMHGEADTNSESSCVTPTPESMSKNNDSQATTTTSESKIAESADQNCRQAEVISDEVPQNTERVENDHASEQHAESAPKVQPTEKNVSESKKESSSSETIKDSKGVQPVSVPTSTSSTAQQPSIETSETTSKSASSDPQEKPQNRVWLTTTSLSAQHPIFRFADPHENSQIGVPTTTISTSAQNPSFQFADPHRDSQTGAATTTSTSAQQPGAPQFGITADPSLFGGRYVPPMHRSSGDPSKKLEAYTLQAVSKEAFAGVQWTFETDFLPLSQASIDVHLHKLGPDYSIIEAVAKLLPEELRMIKLRVKERDGHLVSAEYGKPSTMSTKMGVFQVNCVFFIIETTNPKETAAQKDALGDPVPRRESHDNGVFSSKNASWFGPDASTDIPRKGVQTFHYETERMGPAAYQAITSIPPYSDLSFEELRLKEQAAGKPLADTNWGKQPSNSTAAPNFAPGTLGGSSLFGSSAGQKPQSSGFGSTSKPAGGLFGQSQPTSGFGTSVKSSTGLFGQTHSASSFGAASKPSAGLSGEQRPSTGFGAPHKSSDGLFGQNASSTSSRLFGGGFSQTPHTANTFGLTNGNGFGTDKETKSFGGGGLFGSSAPFPTASSVADQGTGSKSTGLFGSFGQSKSQDQPDSLPFGGSVASNVIGKLSPVSTPTEGSSTATTRAGGGFFGLGSSSRASASSNHPFAAAGVSGRTQLFGFGNSFRKPASSDGPSTTTAGPSSGGLFGRPSSPLFGRSETASSTGGLFGGASINPAQSSTLFGSGAPKPTPSSSGGLFGGGGHHPIAISSSGHFGGAPKPSSLFGATTPPMSSSSNPFGGSHDTSTPFGGAYKNPSAPSTTQPTFPAPGAGLFGSTVPTTTPTTTSTFGSLFSTKPVVTNCRGCKTDLIFHSEKCRRSGICLKCQPPVFDLEKCDICHREEGKLDPVSAFAQAAGSSGTQTSGSGSGFGQRSEPMFGVGGGFGSGFGSSAEEEGIGRTCGLFVRAHKGEPGFEKASSEEEPDLE